MLATSGAGSLLNIGAGAIRRDRLVADDVGIRLLGVDDRLLRALRRRGGDACGERGSSQLSTGARRARRARVAVATVRTW